MAAGATSMALVAAAILGISLAIHRRTRGHRGTRPAMYSTAAVWIGLGLAMFLVRWLDTSASAPSDTFGGPAASAHPTPLVALFFAAIYLISGACTIFEAERLYNPEYFAYVRLAKQYRQQARRWPKPRPPWSGPAPQSTITTASWTAKTTAAAPPSPNARRWEPRPPTTPGS